MRRRDGAGQLGGDGVGVAVGLLRRLVDEDIEAADRLLAAQRVEDLVLLVGEHALQLAGGGDDQRHQRCVAPLERRLGGVVLRPRLGSSPGSLRARRRRTAGGRRGRRRRQR